MKIQLYDQKLSFIFLSACFDFTANLFIRGYIRSIIIRNHLCYKLPLVSLMAFAFSHHLQAQLTGTLNIPGTYASLELAITDLNVQGVGPGGVTLNLLSGNPETAPAGGYVIGNTGSQVLVTSSSMNPVTIQGNGNIITASPGHTIGDLNDGIFKIIGADWVTIRDFTMIENPANNVTSAASNTMTEWGVALLYVTTTDGAQHNTIEDNFIDLDRTYSNTFGIYSNSTHSLIAPTVVASATTAAGSNKGLKIYANNITDVNQGIVVVGPAAAADHNDSLEIGATALNANMLSDYGTSGTFSAYANVSATVNGILVRNTKSFNISFNSVSSSNGGTVSGALYGIYIQSFTNAPTGTFTNSINNNNISVRSAVATGAMNGILLGPATASPTSTLNINANNFNTITHTIAASGAIILLSNAGTPLLLNIQNNTFTNLSVNTTGSVTFISHNYSMPANGSQNVQNNSIVTAFNKTGAGGTVTCLTSSAFSPIGTSTTYTNNNFSNITVTGSTTLNGLVNSDGSGSKTATGNIFNNWTGGTAAITGLSITKIGGPVSNISNNTVTNISSLSSITGLSVGNSFNGATTLNVSSNTVTGLASSLAVTGITCSNSSATVNVNDNLVNTLSSSGAFSTVTGMAISGSASARNVFSNTIHALTGTGISAPVVNGLTVSALAANVYKNKIYNLLQSSSGSTAVAGILLGLTGTGGSVSLYNNLVADLQAPASTNVNAIRGILITGTSLLSTYNVSHNTVFINGMSTGTNFGTSAIYHTASAVSTTANLNLRNNILVNLSTPTGIGKTVAFRRSTGSSGTLANYGSVSNCNLFYAGTPGVNNLIYWDGTATAQTIENYRTGVFTAGTIVPRDGASVSEIVSSVAGTFFQSFTGSDSGFLHMVEGLATQVERGGVPMESILLDYDDDIRNNFPDIGADEFVGVVVDMVGPMISYTLIPNVVCLNNPTLDAVIIDQAGVNDIAGTKPRIWFKKSTNLNVLPGTNENTTDGWKYTEATNSTSQFNFIIDDSLIFGGVAPGSVIQYFIVAQDNDVTPSLMINKGVFAIPPPTVALNASAFPVTGINSFSLLTTVPTSVTIGTGGTYPTLSGAGGFFADLNAKGLSGPTIATIISTPIAETGANALNNIIYDCNGPYTLTIKPDITATLSGSLASNGLIKLNGSKYVTIDGSTSGGSDQSLTIINTSTSTPTAILLLSTGIGTGASNNTIKNCIISTGSNTGMNNLTGSNGIRLTGADNDNITIQNNTITKCYYGVYTIGGSAVSTGGNDNLNISGNTIGPVSSGTSNIGEAGILVSDALNLTISSNTIRNVKSTNALGTGQAIKLSYVNGFTISGNNIHGITSAIQDQFSPTVTGIYLGTSVINGAVNNNTLKTISHTISDPFSSCGNGARAIFINTATAASGISIYNNMISDVFSHQGGDFDNWSIGLSLAGSSGGINIYNNSINLFGSHSGGVCRAGGSAVCLFINTSGSNIDIRNNILTNSYINSSSSSDRSYSIYSTGTTNSQFNPPMDHNDYFVSGAQGVLGRINEINRVTLAEIQAGFGGNTNSKNIAPVYTSSTDLHLPPASNVALDNLGIPISGIFTDVDALPRNIITPDIGADEFSNGCSTKVLNTADGGTGSLRDIIACALDGDPVTFDASLLGQTITLTSGEININKNIGIFGGETYSDIIVSGGNTSRIFNVAVAKQLHLHNMSLKDGFHMTEGGAIYLQGSLLLRNVLFQNNQQNSLDKALTIVPGSTMTVSGEVDMNP